MNQVGKEETEASGKICFLKDIVSCHRTRKDGMDCSGGSSMNFAFSKQAKDNPHPRMQ